VGRSSAAPGSRFTRGCESRFFFFGRAPPSAVPPTCCWSSLTRLGMPSASRRSRLRAMLQGRWVAQAGGDIRSASSSRAGIAGGGGRCDWRCQRRTQLDASDCSLLLHSCGMSVHYCATLLA
jgi:hypothetical protein